jgi:hypothetical protein
LSYATSHKDEVIMSRSWNKPVLFAVLMICGAASLCAQPQAPVVWGETRWLGMTTMIWENGQPLVPVGDTLVFSGVQYTDSIHTFAVRASFSTDNGLSHGPSQILFARQQSLAVESVAIPGHTYLICDLYPDPSRLYHTGDLGTTWDAHDFIGLQLGGVYGQGSRIVALGAELTGERRPAVTVSLDGGQTWNTTLLPTADSIPAANFGASTSPFTHGHIVFPQWGRADGGSTEYALAQRGNAEGTQWDPLRLLPLSPDSLRDFQRVTFCADSTSETALAMFVWQSRSGERRAELLRTIDGGENWEAPRLMNDGYHFGTYWIPGTPQLFERGKLCGMAWWTWSGDAWDERGIYWRFSANHGRDWYPWQLVLLTHVQTIHSPGQFVGNQVRLYYEGIVDSATWTSDFATVTGTLSPDALSPVIDMGVPLSDEVIPGSPVEFLATAWDNDSLPHIEVVLRRDESTDSVVIPLTERVSPIDYRGTWTVPQDTALWHYYYRAEDMWENVSMSPDTGVFSFHTSGWSGVSSINRPPSSFAVRVYPNPSNGWPRIELSAEWFVAGKVGVAVYDALGRKVSSWVATEPSAMNRASTTELATGVYFVRVSDGSRAVMRKVMVVK